MVMPVFLTYYTSEPYREHADLLHDTARDVRVVLQSFCARDLGSWMKNTSFKAEFMLDMRKLWRDLPICWIDADARFRSRPEALEDLDADIAAHLFRGRDLCSGTVWMRGIEDEDDPLIDLLESWVSTCKENPKMLDQDALQQALRKHKKEIRFTELGPELCFIFDLSRKHYPEVEPVIEHLQESRKQRWRK